ncbi:Ltp family lipoprotein [Gordonia zhaorongruii]|uniref:Ltp family lipoprotein n=1 Tax=Gordonia zhaorongruii TaxID=2597659 RepID=UPI00104E5111|nr:Ltp family lipoprotein [Gordonia zhaorongruii]
MRKTIVVVVLTAALSIGVAGCSSTDKEMKGAATTAVDLAKQPVATKTVTVTASQSAPTAEEAVAETEDPVTTAEESATVTAESATTTNTEEDLPVARSNAVGKAQEYLAISAFSRSGLISQLVYEGFEESDAVYAVDSIAPDWYDQAAKKGGEYMSISSFSQQGLVDQLVYDGFTQEQATHGAASQF